MLAASLAGIAASIPLPAAAQLRPYPAFEWRVLDADVQVVGRFGGGALSGQRASLAGTEGLLIELGTFHVLASTSRVALEAAGTLQRLFRDDTRFAPAAVGTGDTPDGHRHDSGDYLLMTTVRLTPAARDAAAALRFGTRLPTTDNRIGLERDQTDFFATLAGRLDQGAYRAAAELGIGIHGTRDLDFEQSDVLVFLFSLGRSGLFRPSVSLAGHADFLAGRAIRGTEELAEIQLGLEMGRRNWIRMTAIAGLTTFSPDVGLLLSVGATR